MCSKRSFRDEVAAKLVIATIARKDSSRRLKREQRAYRCERCGAWHITSRS